MTTAVPSPSPSLGWRCVCSSGWRGFSGRDHRRQHGRSGLRDIGFTDCGQLGGRFFLSFVRLGWLRRGKAGPVHGRGRWRRQGRDVDVPRGLCDLGSRAVSRVRDRRDRFAARRVIEARAVEIHVPWLGAILTGILAITRTTCRRPPFHISACRNVHIGYKRVGSVFMYALDYLATWASKRMTIWLEMDLFPSLRQWDLA